MGSSSTKLKSYNITSDSIVELFHDRVYLNIKTANKKATLVLNFKSDIKDKCFSILKEIKQGIGNSVVDVHESYIVLIHDNTDKHFVIPSQCLVPTSMGWKLEKL